MRGEGRTNGWTASFGGYRIPVHSFNTLVVGSGAAARNAALQLLRLGVTDIAVVTERWNAGTSYNAGSDKQTYYKLALAGEADSAGELARDLWSGGCMHGDIALCEAQGSARAFFNLVELGVPFPHDRYGGFPGYRTDNDRRGRATSAGPLTSRFMCQRLGEELEARGLEVFDGHQAVRLLTRPVDPSRPVGLSSPVDPSEPGGDQSPGTEDGSAGGPGGRGLAVCGALALAKDGTEEEGFGLVLFNARNVVLATGGPGGMYRDSVYPQSQRGSTGMALRIGAVAQNLTESQFGMASLGFRWNLSGSYQQVVPRYLSTDPDGGGEREFLNDPFPDMKTLASAVFRKGYEWPFDADRVEGFGSSLIDLLVHREARSGRRVFLDFTRDPQGGDGLEPFTLEVLDEEARAYLRNSGALGDSPVERLIAMNRPAFQLFLDNGIDLRTDRLEIAVCAQHNNGGLRAGIWWESNVHNLFPIGEVCGTHGVRRPGGAALNAGQVGGWRAARYIAAHYREAPPSPEAFTAIVGGQVEECLSFCDSVLTPKGVGSRLTPAQVISEVQDRMTLAGAQIRGPALVAGEKEKARRLLLALPERLRIRETRALGTAFWAADLALTHLVYLEAIHGYLQAGGGSRGSALVLDNQGEVPSPALGDRWRFRRADLGGRTEQEILEVWLEGPAEVATCWVPVRPLPAGEGWFEEVWREFREGRVLR